MHAVAIDVTFTHQAQSEAAEVGLVSQVSGLPGFVSGYWVALPGNRGISTIVFDSGEAAQGFARFVQSHTADGVALDRVEVGRVLAHA
ncbi:MAG TPA: hypothetical protein VMU89_21285 [Thermomicrobiaceae bacterium]|nr:hypothetical protein [Thermomicrobiaceae bacterium]